MSSSLDHIGLMQYIKSVASAQVILLHHFLGMGQHVIFFPLTLNSMKCLARVNMVKF